MSDFRPLPLRGQRTLVLAFDPHLLAADVSRADKIMVASSGSCLLAGAEDELQHVTMRDLLSPLGCSALSRFAPQAAVVNTLRSAWLGPVLAAARYGVERFFLVDAPGSFFEVNARGAAVLTLARSGRRGLGRLPGASRLERLVGRRFEPPWPSLEASRAAAHDLVAHASREAPRSLPPGPLRVLHFLGTLSPGGAERQLTYLAEGTRARGHQVEVLVSHSLEGSNGHYAPRLRELGVKVSELPTLRRTELRPPGLERTGLSSETLRNLEEHVAAPSLIPLVLRLLRDPPDVLHCWLDQTNLVGALAGLAAGVPRIVMSARNVSPAHMPRLLEPWFRETYQELARCPRVTCIANTRAGADDYAAWSESDPAAWGVVNNGFDPSTLQPQSPAERLEARRSLGLEPEDFLLVGVFRLADEKRPHDFLELVRRLAERIPRFRAVHVGSGGLADEVQAAASELGLSGVLQFAGRREDPWTILGAADVATLTSEAEGLPNVALEAQALEVPMVLTRAGGAAEALHEGVSGFACEIGDLDQLCARIEELAGDDERRHAFGAAGRAHVTAAFSLERMIEASLALYR